VALRAVFPEVLLVERVVVVISETVCHVEAVIPAILQCFSLNLFADPWHCHFLLGMQLHIVVRELHSFFNLLRFY
jgi:hypothetical protein